MNRLSIRTGCLRWRFSCAVVLLITAAQQPQALAQPAKQAAIRLERGIEFAHAGKFADAAQEFVAALEADPKLAEAHYLLGLVRQNWGKWEDARVSYSSALRLKPKYPEAQLGLAAVMTRLADETTLDAAITACRKAVELNPTEPEPHFHLANNEALKANFLSAATEYRTVLRLKPDYPGARLGLADALVQLREFDKALQLLREFAGDRRAEPRVSWLLGVVASRQDDAVSAVSHLARAASLNPDNAQIRYILATNLRKLGKAAEAEQELARYRDLTSGKANTMQARFHLVLAQKLLAAGKVSEAIGEYQESLAHRRDPAVATDLGVALLSARRLDEAIETLRDVSSFSPDSVLAHYHLGLAYAQKKAYSEARKSFEAALRLRPDFAEGLFHLGMTCAMEGQLTEAEQYLRRSVRLRPDLAATHQYLGVVLKDLGRASEAEAEFRTARQLGSDARP